MVYHICNRTLFRGFNSDANGSRQRITCADGKERSGHWICGQLVEVPSYEQNPPILCLSEPGGKIKSVSSRAVMPSTISQYANTMILTQWDFLTKKMQEKWLKEHTANEWRGLPVFEGDIFKDKLTKKYHVVVFDPVTGFSLEEMLTGRKENAWSFEMMSLEGSLWKTPKEIPWEVIQKYHKKRSVEKREDSLILPY